MAPRLSASVRVGPHLLGRIPPSPLRTLGDWNASAFLTAGDDLDAVLAVLAASRSSAATKAFAKVAVAHIRKLEGRPPPPPPVPAKAVLWPNPEPRLDQGQTPRCVGYSGAQFCNTGKVDARYGNADGDRLYAECKVIDGEPGAQDGSSIHSGASALVARGRIAGYAWASTLPAIKAWLLAKGPVWIGADWFNGMFGPDAHGFVAPTGGLAGGHAFVADGYDPALDVFDFENSWSDAWGPLRGRFRMKGSDFGILVRAAGFEACVAVELPL